MKKKLNYYHICYTPTSENCCVTGVNVQADCYITALEKFKEKKINLNNIIYITKKNNLTIE